MADRRTAAAAGNINRVGCLHVTRFEPNPREGLRPNDEKKRRHAPTDAAQAAKGCQKPSMPSVRRPIQPEGPFVPVRRSSGGFRFRYSNRIVLGVNDTERAHRAIKGAQGKRLTYRIPRSAQSARAV